MIMLNFEKIDLSYDTFFVDLYVIVSIVISHLVDLEISVILSGRILKDSKKKKLLLFIAYKKLYNFRQKKNQTQIKLILLCLYKNKISILKIRRRTQKTPTFFLQHQNLQKIVTICYHCNNIKSTTQKK